MSEFQNKESSLQTYHAKCMYNKLLGQPKWFFLGTAVYTQLHLEYGYMKLLNVV